jgi:hypothetical protein
VRLGLASRVTAAGRIRSMSESGNRNGSTAFHRCAGGASAGHRQREEPAREWPECGAP